MAVNFPKNGEICHLIGESANGGNQEIRKSELKIGDWQWQNNLEDINITDGGDVVGKVHQEKRPADNEMPLEDGAWPGHVVEGHVIEPGVRVEISSSPYFGPGPIDPQGQDGQDDVDDPDPEVLPR